MKASYTLLPDFTSIQKPFLIKEIIRSHFSTDFHFHNECQLVHVLSGSGTRIIGDSIEQFGSGDMTFIGSKVPHVWYSKTTADGNGEPDRSIALYINPADIIESLKTFIDTTAIEEFFQKSERGISIIGAKNKQIALLMEKMLDQKNIAQLSLFFQILELLIDSEELVLLNKSSFLATYSNKTHGRVSQLMEFIQNNFKTAITLEDAASVAGLQIHSFCRFFKALTHRTFSDFINEVRIGFASQLLEKSDLPITQVAFESGYSNISYFNRAFKKIHNTTPRAYKQQALSNQNSTKVVYSI